MSQVVYGGATRIHRAVFIFCFIVLAVLVAAPMFAFDHSEVPKSGVMGTDGLLDKVHTVVFDTVRGGKICRQIYHTGDLRGKHRITIDGYVTGILIVGEREMSVDIDGQGEIIDVVNPHVLGLPRGAPGEVAHLVAPPAQFLGEHCHRNPQASHLDCVQGFPGEDGDPRVIHLRELIQLGRSWVL